MKLYQNFPLKNYNTFGVNADARAFLFIESEREVFSAVDEILYYEDYFVLGGGSNVLFAGDFDGIVLKYSPNGIKIIEERDDSVIIEAEAGAEWNEFVRFAASRGFSGAENMAGIPGTVGAAPVQNIGAYGVEQKDVFESLDFFSFKTSLRKTMTAEDCRFRYRDSILKGNSAEKGLVYKVRYKLSKNFIPNLNYPDLERRFQGNQPTTPIEVYDAIVEIRAAKLPDPKKEGNAGSFFKNPVITMEQLEKLRVLIPDIRFFPTAHSEFVKVPAGALIEHAGFKGVKRGPAGVSERHALVLVNRGGATGMEIASLSEKIAKRIKNKYGIVLEPEVLIKSQKNILL